MKDTPSIWLDRSGTTQQSFMYTESILGYVEPNETYRLTPTGFAGISNQQPQHLPPFTIPPYYELHSEWHSVDVIEHSDNLLGKNGCCILGKGQTSLNIPIAETTAENLSFYQCHLISMNDTVSFDTTDSLPVTIVTIGRDYAKDYLLNPELGGGAYLETHDRPHFHMSLEADNSGYIILGKHDQRKKYYLSAFKIPYNTGIYMSPWVVHCDAFLVGRYMMVYSATSNFTTAIIRNENKALAPVYFTNH